MPFSPRAILILKMPEWSCYALDITEAELRNMAETTFLNEQLNAITPDIGMRLILKDKIMLLDDIYDLALGKGRFTMAEIINPTIVIVNKRYRCSINNLSEANIESMTKSGDLNIETSRATLASYTSGQAHH